MKKKIIALVLCTVIMASMFCISAFAIADKTTVISMDNIYDIVYAQNPSITISGNSLYTSSISSVGTVIQSYSTGASNISTRQSIKKIAYNGEQMLLTYYTAKNTVANLQAQVKAMQTTVAIAKVKFDNGLLSAVDYNSVLLSQKSLQSNLLTAQQSLAKIKGNLNLLINNAYDDTINIADFTPLDMTLLDALNRDSCYTDAVNNSMDLAAAKLRLDGAIESDESRGSVTSSINRENAYITYTSAQKTLDQTFENTWNSLMQGKDALALQQMTFATAERTYQLAQIKYQLGLISKVDFDTASQTYDASKVALENSQISLYATYKQFMALVAGVSL